MNQNINSKKFLKVNLLDLFILLFIILVVIILVIYIFLPNTLHKIITDEAEWRYFSVEVITDTFYILNLVKEGDMQKDLSGKIFAELVSFEVKKYSDLIDGKYTTSKANDSVIFAKFKVLAKVWRNGSPQFSTYALIPGESFEFISSKYKLLGTIYKVNSE